MTHNPEYCSELQRDAIAHSNGLKARATPEHKRAYARHAVWDGDARQAFASLERPIANARHTVRNGDAGQTGAIVERMDADARNAVGDHNAGQVAATAERHRADSRDLLPVIDRRDFDVGVGAGSDSENAAGSVSVGHELQTFRAFVQGCSGGEDSGGFHGINPFFPWRSSLGVMPYALGVTISAGTVLCVSHPGLEPAMAALRWLLTLSGGLCLPVQRGNLEV